MFIIKFAFAVLLLSTATVGGVWMISAFQKDVHLASEVAPLNVAPSQPKIDTHAMARTAPHDLPVERWKSN